MVRLARGLVDLSETAEEIVQDAFVAVFERWDRLSEPAGYLRTAVVNGARSELRKREVRRRVGLRARPAEAPAERDYLIDALDTLSPKQRTAIVLRFYAQMSERETAEAMGVRPGTVKSLVSRGLADLRRVIQP
jgi:RNA polymerase sigma factor (sigma-70 family)